MVIQIRVRQIVKSLLLFVYTHNINKTLCFCKIKKTNRMLLSDISVSFP